MDSEFGFLKHPFKCDFLDVSITPLAGHALRLEAVQKDSNRDGFYYPPQQATHKVDLFTDELKQKVEQSERPALLFFLPSSHQLSIQNPICKDGEKGTDEALIIFLLAYVYGTRLMPSKWKFDGRVPIKSVNNIYITDDTTAHFIEHVYNWWKTLTESQRVKFVNILYVFNRARSLEWEWDSFLHQYMVFDALYNFHLEFQPNNKAKGHKSRFNILCNEYSVFNEDLVSRIYSARNNLFHEAMWVDSTIGFGSPDTDAYQLPQYLSELNSQIICGITEYKNNYVHLPWWTWQTLEFDKMK